MGGTGEDNEEENNHGNEDDDRNDEREERDEPTARQASFKISNVQDKNAGVYTLEIQGSRSTSFQRHRVLQIVDAASAVSCVSGYNFDDSGWQIIQRRLGKDLDFIKDMSKERYLNGFGSYEGSLWLGLIEIHWMLTRGPYDLRIDMVAADGTMGYAMYHNFTVSRGDNGYRLGFESFLGGNAGDSLRSQRGCQFSFDPNPDYIDTGASCRRKTGGGWWHCGCQSANLNGYYGRGMMWTTFTKSPIVYTEMKMKYSTGSHF